MNKYTWVMITTLYLIIVTFIVSATEAYVVTSGVSDSLGSIEDAGLGSVWAFGKTFVDLLSFEIEAFPSQLALIFFHPVVFAWGILLLDIIKDLIPFT